VEALADMTPEQLEAIEGIGPKTVEKISLAVNNYFASFETGEAVAVEGEVPAEGPPVEGLEVESEAGAPEAIAEEATGEVGKGEEPVAEEATAETARASAAPESTESESTEAKNEHVPEAGAAPETKE